MKQRAGRVWRCIQIVDTSARVTRQNFCNRRRPPGAKKEVKFKGVEKRGERFRAKIRIDGKYQQLGTFDTAKKAARAYDRAAMQAGRPSTTLNYQDPT